MTCASVHNFYAYMYSWLKISTLCQQFDNHWTLCNKLVLKFKCHISIHCSRSLSLYHFWNLTNTRVIHMYNIRKLNSDIKERNKSIEVCFCVLNILFNTEEKEQTFNSSNVQIALLCFPKNSTFCFAILLDNSFG